jgi:GT2 family glycosyltransferase
VDNGSADDSLKLLRSKYTSVEVVELKKNYGFAGGVNAGIKHAIENGAEYVALLNNDALADKNWLKKLKDNMDKNPRSGIVTSKILNEDGKFLDSSGEFFSIWGLPFPRGRKETDINKYDEDTAVFGASGGASLYRVKMLKEIGLFDENFFAYYEDVDLSFRAQLAGWKVAYAPEAIVYHKIGATSSKVPDFATYQTLKNLPMLMWKNVPWRLMPKVWWRFELAYTLIVFRALSRGQFGAVLKGLAVWVVLSPKKFYQRHQIQKRRKVSIEYLNSLLVHDLPPNAMGLRRLRQKWWKFTGKAA